MADTAAYFPAPAAVTPTLRARWFLPLLTLFVVVLRLPYFNDPAIHIDEQFYLVVADKWLHHGLIPFVDIWDRKPIGLFILYALPMLVTKNLVLGYQILAVIFVTATAALVARIGRIIAGETVEAERLAIMSALVYVVTVMLMDGAGGQTPVFYNFFVAAAAVLYLNILSAPPAAIARNALGGSLLLGLALQVKYLCIFEALALSLFALAAARRQGLSLTRLGGLAVGMMICGAAPTAIVAAAYGYIGHWQEFVSSNFTSILIKHLWNLDTREYILRWKRSSLLCTVFLPVAAYEMLVFWWKDSRDQVWAKAALSIWVLTALFGALMLGNPTTHYFLPTLVPMSLLAAGGFLRAERTHGWVGRRFLAAFNTPWNWGAVAALLATPILIISIHAHDDPRERGEPQDVDAIVAYMKGHATPGCPFVFNRFPILYTLADVCAPSIYAFPNHLSEIAEVRTPGHERLSELARVLTAKPPMIVLGRPFTPDIDPAAIAMLEDTLQQHYVRVFQRPAYRKIYEIYGLKDEEPDEADVADAP